MPRKGTNANKIVIKKYIKKPDVYFLPSAWRLVGLLEAEGGNIDNVLEKSINQNTVDRANEKIKLFSLIMMKLDKSNEVGAVKKFHELIEIHQKSKRILLQDELLTKIAKEEKPMSWMIKLFEEKNSKKNGDAENTSELGIDDILKNLTGG